MKEAYEIIRERIYRMLETIPSDAAMEKYEAAALRDYTAALLNIEKLLEGGKRRYE